MAKAGQAQEPSMEEILASIRRIISDDDAPAEDPAAEVSEADAASEPEVEEMAADASAAMSQDDLDKLFDEDGGGFDVPEPEVEPEPEFEAAGDDIDFDTAFETAEEEPEAEDDTSDVLELTEDFAVEEDAGDDIAFVADESAADEAFEAAETAAKAPAAAKAPEPVMARSEYKPIPDTIDPVSDEDPLVSSLAGAAVSSAFSDLTHAVLSNNGKTLDDLVKEMLRPMLKAWLEANLPTVVERMVRQEIERVSRGRS